MAILLITACVFLMLTASDIIDVMNNSLSALILDQIDNMGSMLVFYNLRTNHNRLTR